MVPVAPARIREPYLGDKWFRLRPIKAANVLGNVFRLDLDFTAKGAKA
jgi:hypothetical protein